MNSLTPQNRIEDRASNAFRADIARVGIAKRLWAKCVPAKSPGAPGVPGVAGVGSEDSARVGAIGLALEPLALQLGAPPASSKPASSECLEGEDAVWADDEEEDEPVELPGAQRQAKPGAHAAGCVALLELDVVVGPAQELEGVEEECLALWETLNKGGDASPPENRKDLIVSLVKTSKRLFGPDFVDAKRSNKRGLWAAPDQRSTRYSVNSAWRERHLALFKLSFHSLSDQVNDALATRYGLK